MVAIKKPGASVAGSMPPVKGKYGQPAMGPSFLRSVEHHPYGEILRDILEPVCDTRGAEEKVARADCSHLVLHPVAAGSSGDDVEFVARMWDLRAVGGSSGKPDLKIAVYEYLG